MKDFRLFLVRTDTWNFARVPAGRYEMSVQASSSHYSRPRSDFDDPALYSAFEIALFDSEGRWIVPDDVPGIPHADAWHGDSVAGYVPAGDVQEIYEYLCGLEVH